MKLLLFCLFATITFGYNPDGMPMEFKTKKKQVVLTFDDGPSYLYTDRILETLKKNKVKASFFLIGSRMIEHPELVKKIYYEGHDLGNHSYRHVRLDKFIDQRIDEEISETNKVFENILGFVPKYFRPPGGRANKIVLDTVSYYGLKPVGWSINANDFLYKGQEVSPEYISKRVNNILSLLQKRLEPGAIILMHNGSEISIAALPEVIDYVHSKGYEFVTLTEANML